MVANECFAIGPYRDPRAPHGFYWGEGLEPIVFTDRNEELAEELQGIRTAQDAATREQAHAEAYAQARRQQTRILSQYASAERAAGRSTTLIQEIEGCYSMPNAAAIGRCKFEKLQGLSGPHINQLRSLANREQNEAMFGSIINASCLHDPGLGSSCPDVAGIYSAAAASSGTGAGAGAGVGGATEPVSGGAPRGGVGGTQSSSRGPRGRGPRPASNPSRARGHTVSGHPSLTGLAGTRRCGEHTPASCSHVGGSQLYADLGISVGCMNSFACKAEGQLSPSAAGLTDAASAPLASAGSVTLQVAVQGRYRQLRRELVKRLIAQMAAVEISELPNCNGIDSLAGSYRQQLATCEDVEPREILDPLFTSPEAVARNQAVCQASRGATTPAGQARYAQSIRQQARTYATSRCAHEYLAHFPSGHPEESQDQQRQRVTNYQNRFMRGECSGFAEDAIRQAQRVSGGDLVRPLSEDTAIAGVTAGQASLVDRIRQDSDERMTCEETSVRPSIVGRSLSELNQIATQNEAALPSFAASATHQSASALLRQACRSHDDRSRVRRAVGGTVLGEDAALGLDELEDLVGGAFPIPPIDPNLAGLNTLMECNRTTRTHGGTEAAAHELTKLCGGFAAVTALPAMLGPLAVTSSSVALGTLGSGAVAVAGVAVLVNASCTVPHLAGAGIAARREQDLAGYRRALGNSLSCESANTLRAAELESGVQVREGVIAAALQAGMSAMEVAQLVRQARLAGAAEEAIEAAARRRVGASTESTSPVVESSVPASSLPRATVEVPSASTGARPAGNIHFDRVNRISSSAQADEANQLARTELETLFGGNRGGRWGVARTADRNRMHTMALADENFRTQINISREVSAETRSALSELEVYQVTQLPRSGRRSMTELALRHPDMQTYLDRMRAMGYELHLDPNGDMVGGAGFFHPSGRRIVLRPNATWQIFIHEYQHMLFEASGASNAYHGMLEAVIRGEPLERAMPPALRQSWQSQGVNVDELLRSLRRQLPHTAANETGAVASELQGLGFRRFTSDSAEPRRYALNWEIHELATLGNSRTVVQTRRYEEAIAELTLIERNLALYRSAVRGVQGAVLGSALVTGPAVAVYYSDNIGAYLIQLSDGTWRTVSVGQMAARIRNSQVPAQLDQGNRQ